MYHPDWYYKNYSRIFARNKEVYDQEVEAVNSIEQLTGKIVGEIGAGTGEHAFRIIKYQPKILYLIEKDLEAAEYLKVMFNSDSNAAIMHGDGFQLSMENPVDIIICMYSIILQDVTNIFELEYRFRHLLGQIKSRGTLFVEVIDYEISELIYPSGLSTVLFENNNSKVQICSHYSANSIDVQYSGKIDNVDIAYYVKMLAINKVDLERLLILLKINDFGFIPLDQYRRRLLVYMRK